MKINEWRLKLGIFNLKNGKIIKFCELKKIKIKIQNFKFEKWENHKILRIKKKILNKIMKINK